MHHEKFKALYKKLKACPCCAGNQLYWSDCAGKFNVIPEGGGGPKYGRLVCRDCSLGCTPCPNDRLENGLAQWNVRLTKKSHTSDYWAAVHVEEKRLISIVCGIE